MRDAVESAIEAIGDRLPLLAHKADEPMRNHTSFKVGGPVRIMFFPENTGELTELCGILHEHGVRPLIIGNGTNLIVDDTPLDMAAIKTTGIDAMEYDGETAITAGTGVLLSRLAVYACERGLSGFEFAHGIPGTLGGAVIMNAGAYGGEMKDAVRSTIAYNPETGVVTITGRQHEFSYRHSRFSNADEIVICSVISLWRSDKEAIRAKMDELNTRRRESQPLDLPSAGSTFKRPKEGYAAALIEQAGLKGYAAGGAQVSEKHSGFVVNRGGASFSDIMAVVEHVQDTVLKRFGIELEPEAKIIRGT